MHRSGHVLWAYGFRPFFLLAAGWGIVSLLVWAAILAGWLPPPERAAGWHGHEMVFGFIGAALAGFLLTAVPSWTDTKPVTGRGLMALASAWAVGRLAMALGGILPAWAVAGADLIFLPWLLALIARPVWHGGNGRHRGFIPLIAALVGADLLIHLDWMGVAPELDLAGRGLSLAITVFALLIVVTVGRITPVVVNLALEETGDDRRYRPNPPRQNLASAVLALYAAFELALPASTIAGWVALAAAAAQLDRLADWHVGRAVTRPYVAILYAAYWWLAAGLALIGLSHLGAGWEPSLGRHAITIGAFGSAILAVFTIAGLRHSGRALVVPRSCILAFVIVSLAALARMVPQLWEAAAILLALALAIFLHRFTPLLMTPRADGKPG